MKRYIRSILTLICVMAVIILPQGPVFAQETGFSGSCRFDGSSISSDFETGKIAAAVSDMQPGDSASFTVQYTNDYPGNTDWYMSNKVIQTLEKANSSRKGVTSPGTGTPENGGYTYELIHTDKDGNKAVLFSNKEVGGDARPGNMQGMEQATNALDDWFYLQTLSQGEYGTVVLNVGFEGETQANDYMDTEGELELKFAVELTKEGTAAPGSKKAGKGIKTGDENNMRIWLTVMAVSGLILLILAVFSIRRDRKGGGVQ